LSGELRTNPSSSRRGQCLLRKRGLRMTTPYRHFANPSSIFFRRLSPSSKTASSNQTETPAAVRAAYRGRTIDSLSSEAWERKRSYSCMADTSRGPVGGGIGFGFSGAEGYPRLRPLSCSSFEWRCSNLARTVSASCRFHSSAGPRVICRTCSIYPRRCSKSPRTASGTGCSAT